MTSDENQTVMYCMNCGLKIVTHVTSSNTTNCPTCYSTSFTSQPPVCEDCGIIHPDMSCSAAEEKFGKPCLL